MSHTGRVIKFYRGGVSWSSGQKFGVSSSGLNNILNSGEEGGGGDRIVTPFKFDLDIIIL